MGLNTTIVVLNDYVHEIEQCSDLGLRISDLLRCGATGEVIPGVKIIETHHADYEVLVKVGGNRGVVERAGWKVQP